MKILADENISRLLVQLATLSPYQEAEVVTQVIRKYGNKLLNAFTVIMPQGVRIRRVQQGNTG